MTVRTIIRNAATVLGMSDVVNLSVESTNVGTLNGNATFLGMFQCFNQMLGTLGNVLNTTIPPFTTHANISTEHLPLCQQGLTYGLLAEFGFANGMVNEARIWNARFEELLFGKRKRTATMPPSFRG